MEPGVAQKLMLLERGSIISYGRNQTEQEASDIDSKLKDFLILNYIPYNNILANQETADEVASWLISRQKGLDTTISF